jgi:hypothetical protein
MREMWKKVEGFEDYEVSSLGRVKSFKRGSERILKTNPNSNGYLSTIFYKNKVKKGVRVHQLVAIAFLNHQPCGMELVVDHINDNKLDNRLENLQVITHRENSFKTQENYSSKYKGVSFVKRNNKWVAKIRINKKSTHIGTFDTEKEASEAYQKKLNTL